MAEAPNKEVPIPAVIFDSLEDAINISIRLLVSDIAKTLGQPKAPLAEAIKRQRMSLYIYEEAADNPIDRRCRYMVQEGDTPNIIQPCGQPVVWSSKESRCAGHMYSPVITYPKCHRSMKPFDSNDGIFASDDNTLYNGKMEVIGHFNAESENRIIFQVSE
jgi:hypothetical protein